MEGNIGGNMAFIETFLFILAGQYIHVLVKLTDAYKEFGTEFKFRIFFGNTRNKLTLILNGSLILLTSAILTRAGFQHSISSVVPTLGPMTILGIPIPASLWVNLVIYFAYVADGYSTQSIFYWLMRRVLKKTGVEVVGDEKEVGSG